jgi:hypothetical protein
LAPVVSQSFIQSVSQSVSQSRESLGDPSALTYAIERCHCRHADRLREPDLTTLH